MKDFRLYDITDFVLDEDFIRWVYEKCEEDEAFWEQWLQQHPGKHLVIAEARRILESLKTAQTAVPAPVIAQEVERLLQTIREQHERPASLTRTYKMGWYAAAAVILLLVAVAGFSYKMFLSGASASPYSYAALTADRKLVEKKNNSDMPMHLTLPDGSSIELAPDSRISYARNFDSAGTRDIYLSGEAFFSVTRIPNRPFRVFSNDIVTKVLGTSFNIRSFESDTTIQVVVRTGKVSVYTMAGESPVTRAVASQPGEVILASNQRLVYAKAAQKFQKVLLDNPVMIVPAAVDRNMVYEEAPLEKVFSTIARAYDVSIVYDTELLKHCTVTADLRNETFYRKLDLVCRAIGATYEIIEGQVVVQASGCN
jgi:transmembrane sensor